MLGSDRRTSDCVDEVIGRAVSDAHCGMLLDAAYPCNPLACVAYDKDTLRPKIVGTEDVAHSAFLANRIVAFFDRQRVLTLVHRQLLRMTRVDNVRSPA